MKQYKRIILSLLVLAALCLLAIATIAALPVIAIIAAVILPVCSNSNNNNNVIAKTFVDPGYKKRLIRYVKYTDKLFGSGNRDKYYKKALYTSNIVSAIENNDTDNIARMRAILSIDYISQITIRSIVSTSLTPAYANNQSLVDCLVECIVSQRDKCITTDFMVNKKKVRKGSKVSKVINALIKDGIISKDIDIKELYARNNIFLFTNVISDVFRQSAVIDLDSEQPRYTSCHCYYNGQHAAGALSMALTDNCYCVYLLSADADIHRVMYDLDYLPAVSRMTLLLNDNIAVYNGKVYGTSNDRFEQAIEIFLREYFDADIEYNEGPPHKYIHYTDEELPYDDFAYDTTVIVVPRNRKEVKKVYYGINLIDANNNLISNTAEWTSSNYCYYCNCELTPDDDDAFLFPDGSGNICCCECYYDRYAVCDKCGRTVDRDDAVTLSSANTADSDATYCCRCSPICMVCHDHDAQQYIALTTSDIPVCNDCLQRLQVNCIVCNAPVIRHHRAIGYHHHHNYGGLPVHVHDYCVSRLDERIHDSAISGNLF